jgi:hypothetical protein
VGLLENPQFSVKMLSPPGNGGRDPWSLSSLMMLDHWSMVGMLEHYSGQSRRSYQRLLLETIRLLQGPNEKLRPRWSCQGLVAMMEFHLGLVEEPLHLRCLVMAEGV